MKVAICFNGLIGTKDSQKSDMSDKQDPDILETSIKYYKKNVYEPNDSSTTHIDTFLQCWNSEYEDELTELLSPTRKVFQKALDKHPVQPHVPGQSNKHYSIWNKWKAVQTVLGLKSEYENEKNFRYDLVLLCRYDISFLVPIVFSKLDTSKVYMSTWNATFVDGDKAKEHSSASAKYRKSHENAIVYKQIGYPVDDQGFMELWFMMNSQKMDALENVYDNLNYLATLPESTDSYGSFSNHRHTKITFEKYGFLENLVFLHNFPTEIVHTRWLDEITG